MNSVSEHDSGRRVESSGRARCPMAKASKIRLVKREKGLRRKQDKETYERGANKSKTSYISTKSMVPNKDQLARC